MANGKCSKCVTVLTANNCSPSVFEKRRGYCKSCTSEAYRNKTKHPTRNFQHAGKLHTFPCGCEGILPVEKGKQNFFACWSNGWACRHCILQKQKKRRLEIKIKVMTHYCKGIPYCQCVGCRNGKENPVHIGALQIDHINGNGAEHRRAFGRGKATELALLLIKKGYPKEFQILCANCNGPAAKGTKSQCPFYGKPH